MYQKGSNISITMLADSEQHLFATRAVLFRRQSKRSCHMSTLCKLGGITDCSQQGGRNHRAHTAQLLQSLCNRICCCNCGDPLIEFFHALIQQ